MSISSRGSSVERPAPPSTNSEGGAKNWPPGSGTELAIHPGASPPSNKRLQMTPNSWLQSIRVTVPAAGAVAQRWRPALLGAAEPQVR